MSEAVSPEFSIIIPVLNEVEGIGRCLAPLQKFRARGVQVVVADGGSDDGTPGQLADLCDIAIATRRGRARQMNAGAKVSNGKILVFLHADTFLPDSIDFDGLSRRVGGTSGWGFCDVRLSGEHRLLRIIERFMNWRSRTCGIGTGDQTFVIGRDLFERAGGFPDLPLMEDIALAKRLKRIAGRPGRTGIEVTTSSRRWEERGILRTVCLMWKLRLQYFLGVSPENLHGQYYR